jgi:multicomponent Na+:H+ antiporter subunit F
MSIFYHTIIIFLILSLMLGMFRILRGPTSSDRMLAAQIFGTTAVALLIILAQATGNPAILDTALIFALLAAVTVVAFVGHAHPSKQKTKIND